MIFDRIIIIEIFAALLVILITFLSVSSTLEYFSDYHKADFWCKNNGFDGAPPFSGSICVNYTCSINAAGTETCDKYYKRIP